MKLENLEDIKECAMEIAEVRKTGIVNMFNRAGVVEALYQFGYDFTAEYIRDNKEDYIELLEKSGEY
ncbi:hypothetical protein UT300003_32240 [Clostridium sardiniense]